MIQYHLFAITFLSPLFISFFTPFFRQLFLLLPSLFPCFLPLPSLLLCFFESFFRLHFFPSSFTSYFVDFYTFLPVSLSSPLSHFTSFLIFFLSALYLFHCILFPSLYVIRFLHSTSLIFFFYIFLPLFPPCFLYPFFYTFLSSTIKASNSDCA